MATTMHPVAQTPVKLAEMVEPNEVTDQFKLNHQKFVALGTAEDFSALSENLIALDIKPLVEKMDEDSYFEITLPMTGMVDFLSQDPTWQDLPQQFPSVIALNGYGAHNTGVDSTDFPRPHYVMVTDVVGNEYEVLIDAQGQVEVPQEGMGLFSILSSITLIYSAEQVLQGSGFNSLADAGADSGMLYMLPPPGTQAHFAPTLRVSHLNDYLQRQIDVEQKVSVEVHNTNMPESDDFKIQAQQLDQDGTPLLHLELLGDKASVQNQPLTIHLTLGGEQGAGFQLQSFGHQQALDPSLGWQQLNETTFEKVFGLSDYAKFALIRDVYSEYDFTRSLLSEEDFGLSHKNNFNDFGLRSEAIGPFYDLLVDGVIHNKIPAQTLFSHVPEQNLASLDLSYAALDPLDQQVVDQMTVEFQSHDFSMIDQIFMSDQMTLVEDLYVTPLNPMDSLPDVSVQIITAQNDVATLIDHQKLSFPDMEQFMMDSHGVNPLSGMGQHDQHSSLQASTFGESLELEPGHQATTIQYQDVVDVSTLGDVIKGFDFSHDKIDLSALLQGMPGASKEDIQLSTEGDSLHISVVDHQSGELHPIATIVGIPPDLHGDDLSQIIVTDLG